MVGRPARAFGELEQRIMKVLWRRGEPATVRDVHEVLAKESGLAYTTVMTVMDRLWRKGQLNRRRRGRAYEYVAAHTEAEYIAASMHDVLRRTRDQRAALAHFVLGIRKEDEAELLRLAREAARRRGTR
jgi:predicted transcriptional regulator